MFKKQHVKIILFKRQLVKRMLFKKHHVKRILFKKQHIVQRILFILGKPPKKRYVLVARPLRGGEGVVTKRTNIFLQGKNKISFKTLIKIEIMVNKLFVTQ